MSLPVSPARGRVAALARELRRAAVVQVRSGMAAWRWGLVALAFVAGGLMALDKLRSSFYNREIHRPVDAWDLFPALATDFRLELGLLAFGFQLFVVDTYHRGREQGIMTTALARMRSRSLYWLGTMGTVGVMAAGYVCVGFLAVFLVGMVFCPPASAWPMLPREGVPAQYPPWSMPVPLYTLLLIAYTSYSLWVCGCLAVLVSVLARHKVVALAFVVLWPILSMSTWYLMEYLGALRLLSLGYLAGMFKHYLKDPFPVSQFFAATGAALLLMALAGAWRLRREEL